MFNPFHALSPFSPFTLLAAAAAVAVAVAVASSECGCVRVRERECGCVVRGDAGAAEQHARRLLADGLAAARAGARHDHEAGREAPRRTQGTTCFAFCVWLFFSPFQLSFIFIFIFIFNGSSGRTGLGSGFSFYWPNMPY